MVIHHDHATQEYLVQHVGGEKKWPRKSGHKPLRPMCSYYMKFVVQSQMLKIILQMTFVNIPIDKMQFLDDLHFLPCDCRF